jgi:hypothetical protein
MSDDDLIKDYTERLRVEFARLEVDDADELLLEIRSHLMERRAGEGLAAALDALGPPEVYAASFADRAGEPHASRRVAALVLRLALICGSALLFLASAILIALDLGEPDQVGLWISSVDGAFYLGRYGGDDPAVRDVLGGMVLPIAIGVGLLTGGLIFHQGRACLRTLGVMTASKA